MELSISIRKGTVWLFTGKLSGTIVKFIFGVVLARILVPADFGLLVTIQIFTGAAGFVAGGGIGQALIQAKEVEKKHFHVVFTVQLLICSLIYAIFFMLAPYFAAWFNNPIYTDLLRVSALNFLFRPFGNIARCKLHRQMRFKAITILSLCSGLIVGVTSTILAIYGYGPWSLVLGALSGLSIATPILMIIAKIYPAIRYDSSIVKRLGSYGIKYSINEIIFYLKSQTPNFIVSKYLGPTTVGLFNKGDSLSGMPVKIIAGAAYQTVFRALSSIQDNIDQSKYIYLRTVTLITVYTFPFYIGLFWLAEPFIVTVYGEKWRLAADPLQVLAIAGLFRCVTNPSGAVMAAQNMLGTEIKMQVVAWILTMVGCIISVNYNNLALIATALLPGAIFLCFAQTFFALKAIQANFRNIVQALKPALFLNGWLTITLAAIHFLVSHLSLELSPVVQLFVYAGSGGLVYIVLFLFYRIPELEKEAFRWKKALRLPLTSFRP